MLRRTAQLESFFNGAWSILEVLDCNFADGGHDLDEMQAFVDSGAVPRA